MSDYSVDVVEREKLKLQTQLNELVGRVADMLNNVDQTIDAVNDGLTNYHSLSDALARLRQPAASLSAVASRKTKGMVS